MNNVNSSTQDPIIASLKKVELHVHLEGAIPIPTIQKLARKNNITLADDLIRDGQYNWQGFPEFLKCYDAAAEALRTEDDFAEATYDYLKVSAEEGVIYTEIIISPTHADRLGLGYEAYLNGIVDGCERAEADHGIVSRLIVTLVRHEGHDDARATIENLGRHSHTRVSGFHIAGNEDYGELKDYRDYFREAKNMGLGLAAHAGEIRGPNEVWAAIDDLGVDRIGHGISAIDDKVLVKRLALDKICMEVCPSSNIVIGGRVNSFAEHPLKRFYDSGVPTTINSDDPPFFFTTIGKEYQIAHSQFLFTLQDLHQVSLTAIKHAFVDEDTKQRLLAKLTATSGSKAV